MLVAPHMCMLHRPVLGLDDYSVYGIYLTYKFLSWAEQVVF